MSQPRLESKKPTTLRVGELSILVHRTVRVAEGRTPASLPPSRGTCEIYLVAGFDCPETWDENGVFVGLHPQEAIWLSFRNPHPLAILVGAGGVNALTGEPLGTALAPSNYMVAPPQPWLDGWKDAGSGNVFQFVAARFKDGKGLSVGEQLLGDGSKSGGIGIAVFESKEPLESKGTPLEVGGLEIYGELAAKGPPMSFGGMPRGGSLSGHEMGIGKGGTIKQRIYPDPHGIEVWKETPVATGAVYLVDAQAFHDITGEQLSPSPISSDEYDGSYFGLGDSALGDSPGSGKFVGLKSVFSDG